MIVAQTQTKPIERREQPEHTLSAADSALLYDILSVQSESRRTRRMRRRAARYARQWGATVRSDRGNLYVTKGTAEVYPCYVAHLDTVHDILPDERYRVYMDPQTGRYWAGDPDTLAPTGVGGDDKCGIAIALVMLRDLPACKIALFRDEEIGCLGADDADLLFFDNCAFAVECDRRGSGDAIRYAAGTELHGDAFALAIAPHLDAYGFGEASGTLTDVMTLKEGGLSIAALNLSAGYYDPHTRRESVDPGDVARTIELCRTIAQELGGTRWEHTAEPQYTRSCRGSLYGDDWGDYRHLPAVDNRRACRSCQRQTSYGWCDRCQTYTGTTHAAPSASATRTPAGVVTCERCHGATTTYEVSYGLSGFCRRCQQWTDSADQGEPAPGDVACERCGSDATDYDPNEDAWFCWDCTHYTADDIHGIAPIERGPRYHLYNELGTVVETTWTFGYAMTAAGRHRGIITIIDTETGADAAIVTSAAD